MNNRIKMTDSKFKCNIFLYLSVTVFMARLSIGRKRISIDNTHKPHTDVKDYHLQKV
jgi:hypothetical protein